MTTSKDHRNTPFTRREARKAAELYLQIAKGNPREAKLRTISMWYSLEFIAMLQRAIDGMSRS